MPLIPIAMANAIKTEMDNVTNGNTNPEDANPADYGSAFDSAAKQYIEDNCLIVYSWIGIMPGAPPVPDPIVSFTASVSFPTFTVGNPPDINAWGPMLQGAIMGGLISPDDSSFVLPPMSFLVTAPMVVTHSNEGNDYFLALQSVCGEIINSLKTMINPTPYPGAHGSFLAPPGAGAIMTSIT